MNNKIILNIVTIVSLFILAGIAQYAQVSNYPAISESKVVLEGNSCRCNHNKEYALFAVETKKDGSKYWEYYGGNPDLLETMI